METAVFKTTGMHCPSCSMNVQLTLDDLEGISNVEVDLAAATTTVEFDADAVTTDAIADAIRTAGYGAELARQEA